MAKIPVKGINPALKEFAEKATKRTQANKAVEGVRKTMSETSRHAKPVQEIVNESIPGLSMSRRANGRREIKSARESANVFSRPENKILLDVNSDVEKRYDDILKNRQRSQDLRDKYSKPAGNIEEAMGNANVNMKREQLRNNTLDMSERGSRASERNEIKSSPMKERERQKEVVGTRKKQTSNSNKVANNETGDNWVYKTAAAGVGGGLVLSMANNKGQQSNSQLYGQGGQGGAR